MMPLQNTATFVAIKPQSVTSGATATGYVDCLNAADVAIDVILDSQSSTTSNPSVLKISQSDITDATGFADITGLVGDATDGFVIPAAGTAATIVRLNVNARSRKRYLKVTVSPDGAAQILAATMTLGRLKDSTAGRAGQSRTVDL
jgi:hypothetical protein